MEQEDVRFLASSGEEDDDKPRSAVVIAECGQL